MTTTPDPRPAAPGGPAPAPAPELVLEPPAPPPAVAAIDIEASRAATVVPVEPETARQLEATATAFADTVVGLDVHGTEFSATVGSITSMGDRELREAASSPSRMLERPVRAMGGGGLLDRDAPVAKSLIDLRDTVESLDPAKHGDLLSPRKLLGVIPFGNRLRTYFDRYQSSQVHLNTILESLYRGQDTLRKDNAAIDQEKVGLWATMRRLQQYALLAAHLDETLSARITQLEPGDPERARALRDDVLFYVRQKHQDLLTQLAVAAQGYLALDLVRKNNLELIKGVDRATTTTVSALRTAVVTAQALANQKLVLDQIAAVNTTTGNLIESIAAMLRRQTGQIHDQAASATISLDQLSAAFASVFATIDAIDTYKQQALHSMSATVDALDSQLDTAHGYLERAKAAPAADRLQPGAAALELPEG